MTDEHKTLSKRLAELEGKVAEVSTQQVQTQIVKPLPVVEEKKKKFKFKIPGRFRVSKGKAKKDWVTVMKINNNRTIAFDKQQIQDQSIMVDGVPRLARTDEILYYKGKPLVIQPAWSVKPFSPTENLQQTNNDNNNEQGWRILIARLESDLIKAKKKMSWLIIIGVVAAIGALGYLAYQGGWFK